MCYLQHTSEIVHGLSSVTQENDLDEFLSTAQLAGTDFAAGAFNTHGRLREDIRKADLTTQELIMCGWNPQSARTSKSWPTPP